MTSTIQRWQKPSLHLIVQGAQSKAATVGSFTDGGTPDASRGTSGS